MDQGKKNVRLKVAICGGGIGGLTLALALAPYPDLEIHVYEAASRFEEIGAGFVIWGRGATVLKKLGLEEKIRNIAPPTEDFIGFEARNSEIPSGGHTIGEFLLSTNWGFHRAQFLELLVNAVRETGRVTIHFGKRCVSHSQVATVDAEIPVTIQFKDGTSAKCDLLVGCDGIRSAVRKGILSEGSGVTNDTQSEHKTDSMVFSGTVAYRSLIKPDDLMAIGGENHPGINGRKMWCGKDKHIVTYPVAGGRFINFIAYSSDPEKYDEWEQGPWVVDGKQEDVMELFHDFEPDIQSMLKCISEPSRWAMYEVEPLPFWHKGHATLLGDAAHGMTPFIGAGGGQVMEDVYVLSRLLGSPLVNKQTVSKVLQGYEHVRRPRATKTIQSTRRARRALEFQEEFVDGDIQTLTRAMTENTEWLWEDNDSIEDDVNAAMAFIDASEVR